MSEEDSQTDDTALIEGVNVYSVPPHSYFVLDDDSAQHDGHCCSATADLPQEHVCSGDNKISGGKYVPRSVMQDRPREYAGRLHEQRRYVLRLNKPCYIPLWDQACLKFIFGNMFDGSIDFTEFLSLAKMAVMVTVNCATVAINVFQHHDDNDSYLEWIRLNSRIVFIIEFIVVYFLLIFLFAVILDAVVKKNISTNLAADIASLSNRISTFSALRVVNTVSPAFVTDNILPLAQNALRVWDYLKALVLFFLWLAACVFAIAAVVLKITQIRFTSTKNINDWSLGEVVQLIGLTMNLARVDDSYRTETAVLLDAIHRHYSLPGSPRDALDRNECLYTRVLDFFGIPRFLKFEYFDVVFDFHFDIDLRSADLPTGSKIRKMLNYLAFILRLDNIMLRRYLQMIQSPLPFYKMGRDNFMKSFEDRDIVGMDIALWRSDPLASPTLKFASKNKDQFNTVFECEDCREVWDSDNLGNIDPAAAPEVDLRSALVHASRFY